ncbi:MAG: hypothetical protein JEY94_12655 [Melioribacteraceae bacterium]|nr:hypothetical protein [Melioribacteraceae bacterium]
MNKITPPVFFSSLKMGFRFTKHFCLIFLFTTFFTNSIFGQVVIKEKVEIEPEIKTNFEISKDVSTTHSLRVEANWEVLYSSIYSDESVPVFRLKFKISNCNEDFYSQFSTSGHLSFTIPAELSSSYSISLYQYERIMHRYPEEVYYDPFITGNYNVYVDGVLDTTGSGHTFVEPWIGENAISIFNDEIEYDPYYGEPINVVAKQCAPIVGYNGIDYATISITEGNRYLSFYDEPNDSIIGDSFYGGDYWKKQLETPKLVYNEPYFGSDEITGIIKLEINGQTDFDSVKILPYEIESEISVTCIPDTITTNTISDINVERILFGTPEPFPPDQLFDVEIVEGAEYGTLIAPNGNSADALVQVEQGFKFLSEPEIDLDTVEVKIVVSTTIEDDIWVTKIGTTETVDPNQSSNTTAQVSLKKSSTKNNLENDQINKDFGFPPPMTRTIYGMGTVKVVSGESNCEEFACDENSNYKTPTIELQKIYSSTYNGIDFCTKGEKPAGQFKPLFDDIYSKDNGLKNELIAPYNIDACYNVEAFNGEGAWQFKVKSNNENNFKLKALVFTCENNITQNYNQSDIIKSYSDLQNIPDNLLCQALKDMDNMRPYPFQYKDRIPKKFYLLPSAIEHEEIHSKRFEQNVLSKALKSKFKYKGFEYSISEAFNFHPVCSNIFNSKENAIKQSKQMFKKTLENFTIHAAKLFANQASNRYKNENFTQWHNDVQNIIDNYICELLKICNQRGIEICEYTQKDKWIEFVNFKNNL